MNRFFIKRREGLITLLLLFPGFATFIGLFLYPFIITLVLSFRPEGQSTGWTLTHYIQFLASEHGHEVIGLTSFLAISTTIFSVLLSVPLALILRRKLAGHRFFRIVTLIPLVVPGLIGALGLMLFFGNRGWFNLFIRDFFPFIQGPVAVNYTMYGLTFFYVWLYFPYTLMTTLSTLEGLDPGIEEAAQVSGANKWQVLRHILIPLLTPGILSGSVLTFMNAFGAFSIPLVAGGNYRPLSVDVYKQIELFIPARWSQASAIAVLMGLMQVAFLTFYMRVLQRKRIRQK
jgi:ABC-type Fe3+ transport system permease subunit